MIEETPGAEPPIDQPSLVVPAPSGWAMPPVVAEVPGAPGFVFASVPARIIAYIVDALVVGTAGAVLTFALGFGRTSARTGYPTLSSPAVSVLFVLLGFAYFLFCWTGGRRATLGQRIFDIQVGNAFDGRPLTPIQAMKRWFGYGGVLGLLAIVPRLSGLASLLELAWVVLLLASTARSASKQGLHDRFANTALVRPVGRSSGGPALACLIILVAIVALLGIGTVLALMSMGGELGPPLDTQI